MHRCVVVPTFVFFFFFVFRFSAYFLGGGGREWRAVACMRGREGSPDPSGGLVGVGVGVGVESSPPTPSKP